MMSMRIRRGAAVLLASTTFSLGSDASEGSGHAWSKQDVLRLIDESTSQPPSSFVLHRTLEKSCTLAATREQYDAADHMFDLDPLGGTSTSERGEEKVVSNGLCISIKGAHDAVSQQHLVDGQLQAEVYRNPDGRYFEFLTDVGWYEWYTGDTKLGIKPAPTIAFALPFHGDSGFSRLWVGSSGSSGMLAPGQLELLNLESATVQDGVLTAQLGHDQHPSAPAEDHYRVSTIVRIELDAGGGPRLLSSTNTCSYLYEGVRTLQAHADYSVTDWMRIGDIDIPRTATIDRFLFGPFMATDPGLKWCPNGQMYRVTMTHKDYRSVTPQEATEQLAQIPDQEGVSVFAEELGLSYKLGRDTIWMDGEPYALPEPLFEHPIGGFAGILESSTFLPLSEVPMSTNTESRAELTPWTSSQYSIALLAVALVLLAVGLWRRWKAGA